jgi:cytoskeletal protein RodZ
VDEELLVEGDGATLESTGSERVDVRDEKEEDTESLCGISLLGIVVVVLFKAFWIISMVQTVCWEGDEEPPAAKLRSSSKLESSSWRSSSCKFQSCFPVENDRSCDEVDCFGRGLPDEDDTLFYSDLLLPRNSCACTSVCFRGSMNVLTPELLFT